ncbi:MAG: hypothetical protein H2069_01295 [Legionella sp.]|nr:hypothetical protein [Legionella sp.]
MNVQKGLCISIMLGCFACVALADGIPGPGAYSPESRQGDGQDPFYAPPKNQVLTGNDRSSSTFNLNGAMDTTPYRNTGTERNNTELKPAWEQPPATPWGSPPPTDWSNPPSK